MSKVISLKLTVRETVASTTANIILLGLVTKQEAQLMLTNQRDAFRGQSRSPNIVSC